MTQTVAPANFYYVGGTMDSNEPSYVERKADQEIFEYTMAGAFCYVLTPRQMGKSSLMVRTAARLQTRQIDSVTVDLTAMVERGMTPEAFYTGLVMSCMAQLALPGNLPAWWQAQGLLTPTQRFMHFVQEDVLRHTSHRLVVFLDEIDTLLNLDFSDDFFALIRAFYNNRATYPDLKRLSVVLLGVASPSDLMQDRSRTPFNIGRRIELTDFTLTEAEKFSPGLPVDAQTAPQCLQRILYWTGGHPYLTQKVCATLAITELAGEVIPWVDTIVEELFLSDKRWEDHNLVYVRDQILEDQHDPGTLLDLYSRILAGEQLLYDTRSSAHAALKLTGIVDVAPDGAFKPRNKIYEAVFNFAWVSRVQRVGMHTEGTEQATLETWQARVYERLQGWHLRMRQARIESIYAFLSAVTLWPLVEAYRGGGWALLAALGSMVAPAEGNAFTRRIQSWKDEADSAQYLAVDLATDTSLRATCDTILETLETFPRALGTLPPEDRAWFAQALQTELAQLGNLARLRTHLMETGVMRQQKTAANNERAVQVLRVVVASPGDVQAERNVLPAVIDDVNQSVGRDRGVRLELWRWETDAFPGFHPEGPQGLIDDILHIEDCDILIGIFWKRFGTPTLEAQSGTEHEFRRAYAAWQQQGKPHIMMYFNQKPYAPRSREETDQWGQVLEFRRHFPEEGLWWDYKGKGQFERFVRRHVTQVVRAQQALVVADTGSTVSPPRQHQPIAGAEALAGLRQAYLTWLLEAVRAVPLSGVDPQGVREESRRDLDLAAVYTALMTQRSEAMQEGHLRPDREGRRLSALAVLNAEPRLALLGDPGSGKSTFVNFVALCLAGELLGRTEANLQVLRAPLPDEEVPSRQRQEPEPQPWAHGPLMPLRVILREFVARGLPPEEAEVSSDTLWDFMVAELPATLRDFAPALRTELHERGGLLLLDGLDEVPEAEQRRTQVKAVVEKFATVFPRVRLLVTSRTYAYQQQDWKLRDFAEAVLAPFAGSQIRRFVERWYAYVGQVRGLSPDDVQGRARLLNEAIGRNPRLHEFATRPLLLTLMASLHAWRGGTLPEQRETLYAEAVELLLDQWESQKSRRRSDGTYAVVEPSLLEWLRVDHAAMRHMLNRLAFAAQQQQPTLVGTADIAQSTLVDALMALQNNPDVRPARIIEYLSDRAGLLQPRGVGVYTLPHRTFQEYLAACHLTDNDFPDMLVTLFCAEPNRWREVVLLAGAKAARGTAAAAWALAEALCCIDPPAVQDDEVVGAWGALLAAQVLIENNCLAQIPVRHRPKVERIRTWLVRTLRHHAFPAIERARAGDALAALGDPRFRADAWSLPDELLLGFIKIPAGAFCMGSADLIDSTWLKATPEHTVTLPTYYMARYPVTVAQFRAFVEASGYDWRGKGYAQGALHHPVVWVSWRDAVAYCAWLTGCLQGWSDTPQELAEILRQPGGRVTLPSEAEWERAARGTEARVYPWGNAPDPNLANYDDTGIGSTSTVGCFRAGASPEGVEELSGNVWEWTRSTEGAYPYPRQKAARARREDLQAPDDPPRVLRGGAYWLPSRRVRCAVRYRLVARDFLFGDVGFRVLVVSGLL